MSRSLRNGRKYDTEKEYVPKTRKRKTASATEVYGELAVVKTHNRLTFGSLPPSERVPESPLIVLGTGKRRGVALDASAGVKLSPAVYRSVHNRAPPIKAPKSYITAREQVREAYPTVVASSGDATSFGAKNAVRALRSAQESDLEMADREPAATSALGTPSSKTVEGAGIEPPSDEDQVYSTARTSRIRDETPLEVEESNISMPQYIVTNEKNNSPLRKSRKKKRKARPRSPAVSEPSPSPARVATQPVSWADEVRAAEGSPGRASSLPDLDPSWVNPDWSCSQYLSAPLSTEGDADGVTETDSVEVNALIWEVGDDYVFSEDQYAEVLRNLREEASETTSRRSQTSGAGPSTQRSRHRVTVEEIPDEDSPGWVTPPVVSDSENETPVGKGKGRAREKRKKRSERPNLGVEVDNLRQTDRAKIARRRSSGRFDLSRHDQTPQGFRSGGYLEMMHGEEVRRSRPAQKPMPGPAWSMRSRTSSRSASRTGRERNDIHTHIPGSDRPHPGDDPSDPSDDEDPSDGTYRNDEGRSNDSRNSNSESDDSDNSDSSSSDDEEINSRKLKKLLKKERAKNKKLVRKFAAQARSGYKAQAPKSYNGEANFDKFELFVFNFDNWCLETKLSQRMRVRNVGRFLEGKASVWYMSNVAPNLKRHDMESIYRGLFDYCFPPDFREELRTKYMSKRQGDQSVQDYFAELDLLGRRLKVSAEQHVQRAWDGAARYIRGEWAIKGILPENTDITELRETAIDIERAHKIRKSIDQLDDRKRGKRDRSCSPDRKRDRKKDRPYNQERNRDGDKEGNKGFRGNRRGRERAENWRKSNRGVGNPKAAKSDKQKDEYRAANKCFECAEIGHMAKDCPKRNKARPSGLSTNAASLGSESKVRASSIYLKELQKLTETKEAIEVSAVRVNATSTTTTKGWKEKVGQQFIERNAVRVKDLARKVPNTIIVQAELEGESVRVLLDSGSQADLVSSTIVDQLRLNKCALTKPLQLQMAMSGSRGMLHFNVRARLKYQTVDEYREFDIGNLDNYDMILGTPFLFQHSVRLSFNPNSVYVGSDAALPMEGANILTINSLSADIVESNMEDLREMLRGEAVELCKKASETELPPFRTINHIIPLIDPNKTYSFIPSKCAEALKPQFKEKASDYLKTGRWQLATGTNAVPMLFIPKKTKDGTVQLRTVLDKRQQNANTRKLASPLPNIEDILAAVCRHKFRTVLDGKDAYEQIRVVPEDVPKTLFHTPMGTMVSLVMQQGDCNAGATYQGQMNHIFAEHIGVFMYVYLDDIIIFSDTIEDHVKHIRIVFDILKKEKFYLSPSKMQFFARVLSILGHIIDDKGIKMDPNKVDSTSKWKTPTSKEQLASYLGALGYLAPNCAGIRIPMAVLTKRASGTGAYRWEGTEERAFRETQRIVEEYRDRHRVAINYDKGAPQIYLVTDASLTGASGFISQGDDWQTAPVAAFWSGKFNTAQQNYSVTDREALAIISSLQKFQHMLHGVGFEILTDHRALEYLMTQKNLSARQARWLDTLSQFEFKIRYIEGSTNVLADALSRIYSDEPRGMVRADSKYVQEVQSDKGEGTPEENVNRPILAGLAATVATESGLTSEGVRRNPSRNRIAPRRYDPEIPGVLVTDGSKTKRAARRRGKTIDDQMVGDPKRSDAAPVGDNTAAGTGDHNAGDEMSLSLVDQLEGERVPDMSQEREINASDKSDPRNITKLVTEIDVLVAIRSGYENDKQFGRIVKELDQFTDYELKDGLLYMKEHGRSYLCIPDASAGEYHLRSLLIAHAHSILAHLGNRKTYAYMRESLWWKNMAKDVESFCNACTLCASSKTPTQAPYGLLKPLPVPQYPWSQIGIDFMGPLPESRTLHGKFDMICVIIDHLTLMVHIIATRQDYTAKDMAEVLYTNVYRLHGMPDVIVSDRDKLFTSQYHRELNELIGTELKFSSAYHPQTDGLTERANRTIMSLVRTCVNPAQRDWASKLPGIEFAINSAKSETTGVSPFVLLYGRLPRPMLVRVTTDLLGVQETARALKYTQSAAHDAIIAMRPVQTVLANKRRRPAPFKVGGLVYVSTKNMSIPEGQARKLAPKYIGPYKIDEVIKEGATYRVELPHEMRKRGIRATFHASLLKPHIASEDRRFPGRNYQQVISLEGDEDDWAVEKIASHQGKGNNALFEIIWQSGDRTWEPLSVVKHLEALKQYYEALGISKASDLPWRESTREEEEESGDDTTEILRGACATVLKPRDQTHPPQRDYDIPSSVDALAYIHSLYINSLCPTTRATAYSMNATGRPSGHLKVDTGAAIARVGAADPTATATYLALGAVATVDDSTIVARTEVAGRPGNDFDFRCSTPKPNATAPEPHSTSASSNSRSLKPSLPKLTTKDAPETKQHPVVTAKVPGCGTAISLLVSVSRALTGEAGRELTYMREGLSSRPSRRASRKRKRSPSASPGSHSESPSPERHSKRASGFGVRASSGRRDDHYREGRSTGRGNYRTHGRGTGGAAHDDRDGQSDYDAPEGHRRARQNRRYESPGSIDSVDDRRDPTPGPERDGQGGARTEGSGGDANGVVGLRRGAPTALQGRDRMEQTTDEGGRSLARDGLPLGGAASLSVPRSPKPSPYLREITDSSALGTDTESVRSTVSAATEVGADALNDRGDSGDGGVGKAAGGGSGTDGLGGDEAELAQQLERSYLNYEPVGDVDMVDQDNRNDRTPPRCVSPKRLQLGKAGHEGGPSPESIKRRKGKEERRRKGD